MALWLLYLELSWATFIGMAAILVSVPLTGIVAGRLFGLRSRLVKLADRRVNLISEVVNGIRVIKFYAWEASFADRIKAVRADEIGLVWTVSKISAVFGLLLFSVPTLIGVAAIGTFSLVGNTVSNTRVYTALSLFNLIRFPLVFMPFILISFLNAKVAFDRLTEFLLAEEAEAVGDIDTSEPGRVRISGAVFKYPPPKALAAPKSGGPPGKPGSKPADTDGGKNNGMVAGSGEANSTAADDSNATGVKVSEAEVAAVSAAPPFTLEATALDFAPGSLVMVRNRPLLPCSPTHRRMPTPLQCSRSQLLMLPVRR